MTTPPSGAHKTLQIQANPNVALITGITGQDGSYLAEFLLGKGYTVHGIIRRSSSFSTGRIEHLLRDKHDQIKLFLHYGDLTDRSNLFHIISTVRPSEVYNLGAMSHVRSRSRCPSTRPSRWRGYLTVAERHPPRLEKATRLYQASTSELYGKVQEIPQKKPRPSTRGRPTASPSNAYWMLINYERPTACTSRMASSSTTSRRARLDLRDAQDSRRAGAHLAGQDEDFVPGQPRREARLGPRARLRRGHVAHGPTRRAPTTFSRPASATRSRSFCEVARAASASRCSGRARPAPWTRSASTPRTRAGVLVKVDPSTSGRRRSTCWSATAPRPRSSWVGRPRSPSRRSPRRWSTRTSPSSAELAQEGQKSSPKNEEPSLAGRVV